METINQTLYDIGYYEKYDDADEVLKECLIFNIKHRTETATQKIEKND